MRGYRAIEKTSGLIDRSGEGRVRVTGAERVAWLQGLLTNDIAALAPGAGCYAAWLTPQGRMITDVRVLNRGEFLVLDLPGGRTADLLQRLDGFIITEDVALEDVSAPFARLGLHGPSAWRTLTAVIDLPSDAAARADAVEGLPEHKNFTASFQGQPMVVAGSRETGGPGVDLYIAAAHAGALRAALLSAGAEEVDDEAWEARRIEVGRALFGVDMTEDTIPLEANLEERAISFSKGCYVGQEIIIRVTHRGGGRVARRLVGLAPAVAADGPPASSTPAAADGEAHGAADSGQPPAAGAPIFSGERQIGHVTSATLSPALGHWIAMAYLHRDFVHPGTAVRVGGESGAASSVVEARVTELPFVAHAAAR